MDDLSFIQSLALQAGGILLKYYKKDIAVFQKPEGPVTVADRESNAFIVERLQKAFPGDAILAEESLDDLRRLSSSRVWCVDPLDDTKGFIKGGENFSVMIGLIDCTRPVLGVVYQPVSGRLFYARKNDGARIQEKDGSINHAMVSSTSSLDSGVVFTISDSRGNTLADKINRDFPSAQIRRQSGSIKTCLVAIGEADAYFLPKESPVMDWDLCAPEAILNEAGGKITYAGGSLILYNQLVPRHSGLVASNGLIHSSILESGILNGPMSE